MAFLLLHNYTDFITSLKTFTGTGFKLYIIFTVIGLFIVFMNTLYKINHKKNRKNK